MSMTNEEIVVDALLKTPEMKKHITAEEIAEYDNLEDFFFYSKNPYAKALDVLIRGITENKNEKLIYDELLFNLKSLED